MIKKVYIGENAKLNKEHLILLLAAALVLLIHTIHIRDIGIFTVLDDEFGYWGNAAYLAGLDWSDTVSKIRYYSYGYSLMLVPLFWIFDDPTHMYKAALFLNGIMSSISFLLCYDIAKKLKKDANIYILMGISFLISMYPSYIVYSSVELCECLLVLICWLLTWLFAGLNEKSSTYKFVLIGFLSVYAYVVHQRALGILIASIIVVLLMKHLNKIKMKQFLMVVGPIVVLLIIHIYVKDYIQSQLWLNGKEISINDYSGQVGKLKQALTINGLLKICKGFIGQIFYLGAASYLVFYFGLFELIQKTGKKTIALVKRKTSFESGRNDLFFVYAFLFIALLLTMAISVVFMMNPILIDQIIYGRYNEMILGPILLIGFVRLMNKKSISTRVFIAISIAFGILTGITSLIINTSGLTLCSTIHIIGVVYIKGPFCFFLSALLGVMAGCLIWISFTKENKQKIVVTLILIASLFMVTGERGAKSIAVQNQERMQMLEVVDTIASSKEDLPICFFYSDPNNYEVVEWNGNILYDQSVAACYQFLLKDKNIMSVDAEELSKIPGDKFVITTGNVDISDSAKDYKLLANDDGSYLFKIFDGDDVFNSEATENTGPLARKHWSDKLD